MTQVVTRPTGHWRSAPVSVPPSRPLTHAIPLSAVTLTVLGLALRLYHIDHESLWLDEGYTLLFSHLPLVRLFLVGGAHEHPPLYYLLVHILLSLHDSYLFARVVSAVAGALSVYALYALGARLFDKVAGLVAAALLAVSPFHVWYGQDARGYELAGLMVLLSYLSLFVALERPGRRPWIAYIAATALALYAEYTTVLVLLPQALVYIRARQVNLRTALLWAWGGVLLAFSPWIGTVAMDAASIAGQYWIPPPTLASLSNTVLEFVGFETPCPATPCVGTEIALPALSGHEIVVGLLVIACVVVLACYVLIRRDLDLTLVLAWLIIPFALVLLLAIRRSLYLDRVFLDASFPFYLLLGALVRRTAPGALRLVVGAAIGLLILSAAGNLKSVYAGASNPDWKGAIRDFQAGYRPGQAVVFNPAVLRSLAAAYLPAGWRATTDVPLWYRSYLDVPGWQKEYAALTDPQLRDLQLAEAATGRRQVWMVAQDYSGLNDTRHWFISHGFQPIISQIYDGDARIELYDRIGPADLGPRVVSGQPFDPSWSRSGQIDTAGGWALEKGHAILTRSFPVTAGAAYSVNLEYQAFPPASPAVSVQTYDLSGRVVGSFVDRFGQNLDSFPRTEWFDMPVTGVWESLPFGFVAPPGAAYATIRLQNLWGWTAWRNMAVYREL